MGNASAEAQTLRDIQAEQFDWLVRCFGPNQAPWESLLGLFEEHGEAMESITERDKFLDAIGDSVIFLLGYCNRKGWDIAALWDSRFSHEMPSRPWPILLGRISHHELKSHQQIRGSHAEHNEKGQTAASTLLAHFDRLCKLHDTTLISLVSQTWNEVKQRAWDSERQKHQEWLK